MSERSRSRRPRPTPPPRDQEASSFTRILELLVASLVSAKGAAMVDAEGETVDYAGVMDPFDLKIAAAHWQIVLAEIRETPLVSGARQITVRARGRGYVVRQLPEGYALVVVFHPRAAFAASERTLDEIEEKLCAEAGWVRPAGSAKWFRVEVEPSPMDHSRPRRVRARGKWQPLEVMGAIVGLRPREKGFRVRLPSGLEMLLVRECRGRWFADEHVEELV